MAQDGVGKEVDFAIDDRVVGGPPALIQISEHLDDPTTRQREVTACIEAMTKGNTRSATIVT